MIYIWSFLRSKYMKSLWDKILSEWGKKRQSKTEPEVTGYLKSNAGLFFDIWRGDSLVISEVFLGPELRVDFVRANDKRSFGFRYEFIECESPGDRLFNKDLTNSKDLRVAINQIQGWEKWCNVHKDEMIKYFPSWLAREQGVDHIDYKIVIGRRGALTNEEISKRNHLSQFNKIEIRSFGIFSDNLKNLRVGTMASYGDDSSITLSKKHRNELANPFVSAFSFKDWKNIVSYGFIDWHSIGNNIDKILSNRSFSKYFDEFKALYSKIDKKKIIKKAKEEEEYFGEDFGDIFAE